jgi:uncharacterized membrane protein YfcA
MLYIVIIITAFLTSVLSGLVGMAGGAVLIAVLITILPVSSAMILHGATQAIANGSRTLLLREHLVWRLLPGYGLGAACAIGIATWLVLVPDPGVVLIAIGIFPWAAQWSSRLKGLDITQPMNTVLCGFSVTFAQLIAGAAGPILDVFYINSGLGRQAIVANKALTQTIGHLLRILYYGALISMTSDLPGWIFVASLCVAILGTRVGTMLLARWNDADFTKLSRRIILTVATVCIFRGTYVLAS